MPSELITERCGATLVLTVSDPESRNTLSQQVCAAGVESLNVAESDDAVRCVVLKGAGQHFSAGANLDDLLETTEPGQLAGAGARLDHLQRLIEAVRVFPKPVIAAVEGAAAGSGFALALACDMIIAAEDSRFAMSYGRLGLSPDGGCSWQLMQLVPRQLAMQMMWLPETSITARQLLGFGIVNWLCESGQTFEFALGIGEKLARMAPNALASVKELVYQWPGRALGEQMTFEAEHFMANIKNPNAREGIEAFLKKRPPRFV